MGLDINFEPEFKEHGWATQTEIRIKQSLQLLALQNLDTVLMPTRFEAESIPSEYQHKCETIHEGIDTTAIKPLNNRYINFKKAG